MDEITKRSGGQVTFTAYYGGALGGVVEHLGMIKDRTVDLGKIPLGANPKELPAGCWEHATTFGPKDAVVYTKALRTVWDEFPILREQFTKQNIKQLFIYPWGAMELLSTVPIRTLADFEGKRVMIWGYWYPKQFDPISGVMSTPAYERYMNLKMGVADIDVLTIPGLRDYRTYEVAKHFTDIGIGGHCICQIFMNLDAWNELTPELQKIFTDVGRQMEVEHAVNIMTYERETREFFKAQGVTFYEMSEADRKEWADLLPDLGAEWATMAEKAGYPGWEIMEFWQDTCEDMGHEWIRRWGVR